MSVVSNVILIFGCGISEKNKYEIINNINTFINYKKGFKIIEDSSIGGNKNLECDVAIGAFNHFDLQKLIEYLRKLDFKYRQPEFLQLMVLEEEDRRFKIIDIL